MSKICARVALMVIEKGNISVSPKAGKALRDCSRAYPMIWPVLQVAGIMELTDQW